MYIAATTVLKCYRSQQKSLYTFIGFHIMLKRSTKLLRCVLANANKNAKLKPTRQRDEPSICNNAYKCIMFFFSSTWSSKDRYLKLCFTFSISKNVSWWEITVEQSLFIRVSPTWKGGRAARGVRWHDESTHMCDHLKIPLADVVVCASLINFINIHASLWYTGSGIW